MKALQCISQETDAYNTQSVHLLSINDPSPALGLASSPPETTCL